MEQSNITFQHKMNELRLDIENPNNRGINFVFVEGESDIRLFRKLFHRGKCKVEKIPGGKINLEKCVSKLVETHSFIIGIRDADFIHLSDEAYSKTNMFLTDFHDMEMTMLAQDVVLSAFVFEYTACPEDRHPQLRNDMMKSIEMLGYLKWLNDRNNLELDFSPGFQDLLVFSDLKIDFSNYLQRVISKSANANMIDEGIINERINELKDLRPDLMQLTNGHDLLNVFAAYFRKKHEQKSVFGGDLEKAIRMTFTFEHFKKTKLYGALNKWKILNETELFMREANNR